MKHYVLLLPLLIISCIQANIFTNPLVQIPQHLPIFPKPPAIFTNNAITSQKRAIVIGASVGMGREVAIKLAKEGYIVGMAARRLNKLRYIQKNIPTKTYITHIDLAHPYHAARQLRLLINRMGGLDLIVLAATGFYDTSRKGKDWTANGSIINVDVTGFYMVAHIACNHFEKQGHGHLVGFTSVDGLRGIAQHPTYSAAKAFCSRYLEAKRNYFMQKNMPIYITELVPGCVNSYNEPDDIYIKKYPEAYWIDSLSDATADIMDAIKEKKSIAYITNRWEQVAHVIKEMPDELYNEIGGL